jgi:hypothetical protein
MSLLDKIYEHLKTKKKYNTLQLRYDILREDLDKKTTELNVERQIWKKKQHVWEDTLLKQEQEIVELKRRKGKKNVSKSKVANTKLSGKTQNNK